MAKNIVSNPPLMTAISDDKGRLTRAWSIWFRDLYTRTSYKGGNAIDDNKAQVDEEILAIDSTLADVIVQVNDNAADLSTHEGLSQAHGSNGNIVGFDDLSTELLYGLVKRMESLANAPTSGVLVSVPDASPAPATYSQAHSQELVDLSNANKAAINTLVNNLNSAIIVLNNLIARSKASGQMTS